MAVGSDPQVSDDLFTKIALENKLVTKYQLRKASEEQQRLESEGEDAPDLGRVLIQLGFLSERQHQSVVNACAYRSQRDYDKRFGRQCLRMELLQQDRIEEALGTQKAEYMKSGVVRPLAEILEEEGALDTDELQQVQQGILQRDRARAAARSGKNPALATSTTTPVAMPQTLPAEEEDDDADLDDVDLDDDDDADLDDVDLDEDDEDEDDDADLDDADLDDADLDDADLDDADLDDADLDDVDLDDVDLDDADLDEVDIDDLEDEGDENEEATSKSASAVDIDLDGVDLDDDDGDGEDEADLAEVVSAVDSEVRLDEDDLRDLETMGSAEEKDAETAAWTADAFDDRPLDKRPSERGVAQSPEPQPATPAAPPMVPQAAGSARLKPALPADDELDAGTIVAGVPSGLGNIDRDDESFPGSDVFEAGVSDMGQIADLDDEDDEDDDPRRTGVASTASDLSPLQADDESEDESPPATAAAGPRDSEVHFGPRALARAAAQAAARAAVEKQEASGGAPSARDWREDPRLRMAFEKALQAAWEVFLQELDRGEG